MKVKKLLPIFLSAAAFTAGLSGCSDYDNDLTAEEIQYRNNFVKTFGKIDPEQDWNLATRAAVTVTTSSPSNVKVYAKTDGTYRIVADYDNVSGTKQLGFDMREDVTELVVTNGSESHYVKPGDNVTFGASTRAIYEAVKEADKAGVKEEDYEEFDLDKYLKNVVADTGILPEEKANLGKVTQNFSYISNGPFTIHPIYWYSSSSHVLGVYWKEGNEYHYQDVYKDMDADAKDLATRTITYTDKCEHLWKEPTAGMTCKWSHGTISRVANDSEGFHMYKYAKQYCYDGKGIGETCTTHGKKVDGNDGQNYHDSEEEMTCPFDHFDISYNVGDNCPTCGKEILYIDGNNYKYTTEKKNYTGIGGTAPTTGMVYSKGITIDLPAGTLFGFYLKVYTGGTYYHTLYSQGELNEKMKGDFFDKVNFPTQTGANACKVVTKNGLNTENSNAWAATFQTEVDEQTVQYLCFEDWSVNKTDLNDLVFATPTTNGYTPPSIVDEDADTWIICAEDLGNTFDLDYNDVVVEVSHVSGKAEATITPVAAGGTLASYIYFNNGSEDKCLGEIHELLGQSNQTSGEYYPFNVSGKVNTSYSKNIKVEVPTTWSIASSTVGDTNFDASEAYKMGGFYVNVVPAGTASTESNATVLGQKVQNSFSSGGENIPYVFCVPRDWERIEGSTKYSSWFRWSKELTPMSALDGYSNPSYNTTGHSFAEWVADHTVATDWYKFPLISSTMGIKGITETTVSSSDDGNDDDGDGGNDDGGNQEPTGYLNAEQLIGTTIQPSVFASVTSTSTVTIKLNLTSINGNIYFHYLDTYESPTAANLNGGNLNPSMGDNTVVFINFDAEKLKTSGLDLLGMQSGSKVWVTIE